MSRNEVYAKVQKVLVDALGVDDEEVKAAASLKDDLGMESIDLLDIMFRLEKEFGIKIPRGELIPEDVLTNPQYVQAGRATPAGLAELKKRMPHLDMTSFEKDPAVEKIQSMFTVDSIVNYMLTKV